MKFDPISALNRATARHLSPTLTSSSNTHEPTAASPAALVALSREASDAGDAVKTSAAEMREFLSKFDFHNITPRQMAEIGGELFGRKEISDLGASAFIGVANATIVALDPNKPIDAVAHFEHLLSVERQYAGDAGTDNGVRYRQTGLDVLRDVVSFSSSDRLHISS